MLAVKKVRSYQIPDDTRELIAVALDWYSTQSRDGREQDTLAKLSALFRSDAVAFSVAMSGEDFVFIGDDGRV